jgi:hypothetical protein
VDNEYIVDAELHVEVSTDAHALLSQIEAEFHFLPGIASGDVERFKKLFAELRTHL